jgi:uncharacterized membrane protein
MPKITIAAVLAIATAGLFLTVMSAGVLSDSQNLASSGTISSVGVGVYTDSYCTVNCTSINWGNLAPGTSASRTVYIKNTGNNPETLSMAVGGWNPSNAPTYLTQTWDRTSYSLGAGASVSATLVLTVSSNAGALSSFAYNIVITGTQ